MPVLPEAVRRRRLMEPIRLKRATHPAVSSGTTNGSR